MRCSPSCFSVQREFSPWDRKCVTGRIISDKRSGMECKGHLTIFTRDQDIVLQLLRLFSSNSAFKSGSVCRILQVEEGKWKSEVDGSSVIVLHLSHSPETPLLDLSDVEDILDYCREKHGPENMKVVISDVEDINLERKITDWWMAERYWDLELLTFSKTEMRSLIEHEINPLSAERRMVNKLRHIHQILQEATEKKHQQALQESARNLLFQFAEHLLFYPWCRVGIFFRSEISDDSWIRDLLQSDHFRDHVSDVTHYEMRNYLISTGKCSFSILYFTKNKEQINEIDVTDVQQIQHYRSLLGKDNVIIVMDDVEDSSDQKKTQILESHPDIKDLYHNLFLFSPQEKSSEYGTLLSSLLNINKPPQPQAEEAGPVEDERPKEMAALEEEETPLEEKKSESGHGAESDGQRRESGQGAESEGASDKRSGVECRERLNVFTRDQDIVVAQLLRLFSSNPAFKSGSVCHIFQVEEDTWKSEVDGSSVIVLHLSHSPGTSLPDLSDVKEFLDYCRKKHDPENIKVVISDVEDISLERKITDWWMTERYRDWELLTIRKTEMRSLIKHKINPLSAERRMANKLRHIHQILQEATEKKHQQALQKSAGNWLSQAAEKVKPWYRVGIFSKSAIIDYSWITELLQSDHFRSHVSDVTHYDIRNSWMCSFGILYFTKKKEQINEIDVTDVQQIQHFRSRLGKDNVIIIMDDVEDSSDQKKTRMLESHPDIEDLYHNLFLFSPQEKSSEYGTLLSSLLNINKPPQPQAEEAGPVEDERPKEMAAPEEEKTPLEEKKSESGHGAESDGQRRESGQGAESEGASDKRSGMECRERLNVFTRDPDIVEEQLLMLFSSNSDFKCGSLCCIFQDKEGKWKSEVDGSSFIVLHLSHSPETPLLDLSDVKEFLDYCRVKHDPENIKVVITDVEDIHLERLMIDKWMEDKNWGCELLTLNKAEMRSLIEHEINPLSAERRMANKLRHIYQILQEAAEKKHQQALQKSAGNLLSWVPGIYKSLIAEIFKPWYSVGIFFRSAIGDYSWITDLFQSDHFRDRVSDVRLYGMGISETCSFGILYFNKKKQQINEIEVTDVQKIQHYRSLLGKDNVIIVIEDVEDSSDQKKKRILESHPDIEDLYHNLFLFSPQEKSSEYRTLLSSLMNINKPPQPQAEEAGPVEGATGNYDIVTPDGASNKDKTPEASFKGNMDKIRKIMESTRPIQFLLRKSHTVGIFSRSSESDYEWLIKQLKSEPFLNIVSTANHHYISNNGMRQFRDDVSRCTFGILYHTRNRGRINIVDVTSSLYDEEINYISQHLGKEKVIVVVDDLEDASNEEKRRILESQPSIGKLARDLFLFNANDKKKQCQLIR